MNITTTEAILSAVIALLIGLFAAYLIWSQRKLAAMEALPEQKPVNNGVQLAAYERLTLLTERLKINNLATRLIQSASTAQQLHQLMLATIRDEVDHNITQQLYVKKEIWDGVIKMRDQNTYIINQLMTTLPSDASALDLSRRIVQFSLENPNATLNAILLDAIRHEAKELV